MKLEFQGRILTVSGSSWTLELPIIDAIQVENRVFVIFDYMSFSAAANNLTAFDLEGNKLWVVDEQPVASPTAAYTNFIEAHPLKVANFAGFVCTLEPATGQLLEAEFTK